MRKLLVIENDNDIFDITSILFENEFEIIWSPKKLSLAEIELIDPALIMIDYLLDGYLGTEVCLELKQNPATQFIPVFLFSTDDEVNIPAYTSCADAFISKPIETAHLADMIRSFAL